MTKKSVLGVSVVTVFLLAFYLAGCTGGTSALVGKWVPEEGQNVSDGHEKLELSKDGTGIGDGFSLTWTAEKGRLTFKLDIGMAFAYDYKISGSTLTLTDDKGESVKYKKE